MYLKSENREYEDSIDLIGEVRAAELKAREGGNFSIQLDNGESVPGVFSSEQESIITEALKEHKRLRLRIMGRGEFESSGRLRRIIHVECLEERMLGETPFDPKAPPIWEVIAGIGNSVPREDWDKVPTDLSLNLEHYLYGDKRE